MNQFNPYFNNARFISSMNLYTAVQRARFKKRSIIRNGKFQFRLFSNGKPTTKTKFFTLADRLKENCSLVRSYLITKSFCETLSLKNRTTLKRWEFSKKALDKAA